MTYQLTPVTSNPGSAFVTSGTDGHLWSVAANTLYWHDGCGWQAFATFFGGVSHFAVRDLKDMWAIRATDSRIYNFNGIAWSLRSLPQGGARRLSIGFDGVVWCLDDNAAKPQVWRFDAVSGSWIQFGQLSETDPTFVEISSGGTSGGGTFLIAIDAGRREWRWTDSQTGWEEIPGVTQEYGRSIAAGPDRTVFLIDSMQGQLWKWKAGEDSNWVLLNARTGLVQVSAQADGKVLAVDGSGRIYGGAEAPSLKGFRGSDWNNAGTKIFAVRHEGGVDKIYRSDDGITFEPGSCGSLPGLTPDSNFFWFAIPLFIPTARFGDSTEKMLIAPIGSQKIYRCNDIGQATLTFSAVHTDPDSDPETDPDRAGVEGIFNGFAEDADHDVYAGWYAINSSVNKAILYKSTRASGYGTWTQVASWEARHIHTVRVNPYNGYLYVVLGEPRDSIAQAGDSADAAKVMRSKDGGASWACVTDTWHTPVMPAVVIGTPPFYLGLYFATLGFVKDRVVLGEDTDFKRGRIFYFDDDGRDGSDPARPLPFIPQPSYTTCNNGEFFFGAVSLGDRLYFASQFLAPTPGVTSTRCVSTADGLNWKLEQVCAYPEGSSGHASFGVFTHHPERRGRLIYSLSATDSFVIDKP